MVVLIIDALFLTSMVTVCVYAKVGIESDEVRNKYFTLTYYFNACLFGILFIALALAVIFLIRLLWRRNKQVQQNDKNIFRKEICTLVIILILFCQSYALRCIFDLDESKHEVSSFSLLMSRLALVIPFSLLPFSAMFLLHRRNLKASKLAVASLRR